MRIVLKDIFFDIVAQLDLLLLCSNFYRTPTKWQRLYFQSCLSVILFTGEGTGPELGDMYSEIQCIMITIPPPRHGPEDPPDSDIWRPSTTGHLFKLVHFRTQLNTPALTSDGCGSSYSQWKRAVHILL